MSALLSSLPFYRRFAAGRVGAFWRLLTGSPPQTGDFSHQRDEAGFLQESQNLSFDTGRRLRMYRLDLATIPVNCFPLVIQTQRSEGFLTLLERVNESTFLARFPDGRESLVSQYIVEKVYTGRAALSFPDSGLSRWRSIIEATHQIRRLFSAQPGAIVLGAATNILLLLAAFFTANGFATLFPTWNRTYSLFPALLTFVIAALLIMGFTDLWSLQDRRSFRSGNRSQNHPLYSRSNLKPILDCCFLPMLLVAVFYSGSWEMALPFLTLSAALLIWFCTTEKLDPLYLFARRWADAIRWFLFGAILLSSPNAIATGRLSFSQVICCLVLSCVGIWKMARMAPFFRNLRVAFLHARSQMPSAPPGSGGQEKNSFSPALSEVSSLPDEEITIPTPKEKAPPKVEVTHLTYQYPHTNEEALKDIEFFAKAGARIGLLGCASAGKSTFCRALAGRFPVLQEHIRIQGRVALLPTENRVLQGTISSNILLANSGKSHHDAQKLIEELGIEDALLGSLDSGLQSRVIEGGASLSVLQTRLLGLCHLLLSEPQILLLDDPIRNLCDRESEIFLSAIDRFLEKNPDSILIIAAREQNTLLSKRTDSWMEFAD